MPQGQDDDVQDIHNGSEAGSHADDNFNEMLNNIMGNSNEHEEDDEVVNALMDNEKPEELGPKVSVHVADAYTKAVTRPLSKESVEKLRKSILIPDNCTSMKVPKLNPEIWQHLPSRARLVDLKSQKYQSAISSALCVLATMSDEIAKNAKQLPKELVGKLLKMGIDGANLIGSQFQEINQRRRLDVKPYMNQDYSGICSAEITNSEFLFGNNLAETLRSTKAAAAVIRNSTQSSSHRFRPYPSTSRGSSLNFQRPFPYQRGRWNGPNRGRSNVRGSFNRWNNQNQKNTPDLSQSTYQQYNQFKRQ